MKVGEQKPSGCKGVISGVPLSVSMKELVEHMKACNNTVKDAKRMNEELRKRRRKQ